MSYNSQMMYSQPMANHQRADADAYDGKSAETRNLKPGELSTGTTIMAVQFDGGVVLSAGQCECHNDQFRFFLFLNDKSHSVSLCLSQTLVFPPDPMSPTAPLTKSPNSTITFGAAAPVPLRTLRILPITFATIFLSLQ